MKGAIKRALLFLGAALVAVGLRIYAPGLAGLIGGEYTAFDRYDREINYDERPRIAAFSAYERLDLTGGEAAANGVIAALGARVLAVEKVGEITVYYARSNRIMRCENTRQGRVNVMIAVSGERVTVGSPLIKGSF